MKLRQMLLCTLALIAAFSVSDQILYKELLVPRLGSYQRVPVYFWIGIISPIIIVTLFIGSKVDSWKKIFQASMCSALTSQAYEFLVAKLHQAGHMKSSAVEAPIYFATVKTIAVLVFYMVLYSVYWFGFSLKRRRC